MIFGIRVVAFLQAASRSLMLPGPGSIDVPEKRYTRPWGWTIRRVMKMSSPDGHTVRYSVLITLFPALAFAKSPYHLSWATDGPVLGAAGLFGITTLATNKHLPGLTVEEVNALSPANVNAFDRPATSNYAPQASDISTAVQYTLFVSPGALLFDHDVSDDITTVGTMYLEAVVFAATTTQIAKNLVDRPRPYAYNLVAPLSERTAPDARRSMFSGHTTFAFASAVFLSTVYSDFFPGSSWSPYIWAGSLSGAAAVAIMRVTSGQHFPTDILIGAGVGSGIGYLIPLVHRTDTGASLSFSLAGSIICCTYRF
jgi:membrane-associated phospholipid phosphatase